jgi:hypothetical protein
VREKCICKIRDDEDFKLEVLQRALLAAFPQRSVPAAPVP